jgi:hypothetical protein
MSSRSLAAARSRRSGDNAPPVSGNRPVTSIGSHAAFAPQQQLPPGYNHNMQPNNVRASKQPTATYQQVKQSQQMKNGLPFAKLSISDAIGLITLRLGRVEQWVIETEHENENETNSYSNEIPENSKIIDNSVLASIIHRLDSVEKKEPKILDNDVLSQIMNRLNVIEKRETEDNSQNIIKLSEDVIKLTAQLTRIGDEGNKHTLAISKHTEQLFKFEREFVETKDILKTFMLKYDMFTLETNEKFMDFEVALSDLEKNIDVKDVKEENKDVIRESIENENIELILDDDLKHELSMI